MSTRKGGANTDKQMLKAGDIAELLNISKTFAYKLMRTGQIRTVKIGAANRVRYKDLVEFIEKNLDPPLAV